MEKFIIVSKLLNKIEIYYFKVKLDRNVTLNGVTRFTSERKGTIYIGADTIINSGRDWNIIGGDSRTVLRTVAKGSIQIGRNVGISNSALVSGGEGIIIEDDVLIGGGCKIYDTDFHSITYKQRMCFPDQNIHTAPVCLKKGCFIGAHSIILKGVTIGEYSVVGAGSVVTKDIEGGQIWAGNPAKFIKKICDPAIQ